MLIEFVEDPTACAQNEKLARAVHHVMSKAIQDGNCEHCLNDRFKDENPYLLYQDLVTDKDSAANRAVMLFREFTQFNNLECRDKEFNSYYNSAKKYLSNLKKEKILSANVIASGLIMSHCQDVEFFG